MCRHLLYLGSPQSLRALLFDPPHSLARQSWAPREMRGGGTINADGFGVGWFTGGSVTTYRRDCPIWSDTNLTALAPLTISGAILAAVRSATEGMTVTATACAPFAADGWLFSHNGVVEGWPHTVAELARRLPTADLLTLDAPTDSALLWALVRHELRAGTEPATALATTVASVLRAAPGSRLNLLLTDGERGWATTVGHSLWLRHEPDATSPAGGRVVVASEPFDHEPGWIELPDRTLIIADQAGYELENL